MRMNSYDYLIKLFFPGDSASGKTSLLHRFDDRKEESLIGTEFKKKEIKVDGLNITLLLFDTASQERFFYIDKQCYRSSAGVFLVYDFTKRETYEYVPKLMEKVKLYGNPELSILLVGYQQDLEVVRQVSYKEAQQFAKECGLEFYETSAKTGENIEVILIRMIQIILEKIKLGKIDLKDENSGIKQKWINPITKIDQHQQQLINEEKKKQNNCNCF